MRHKCGESCKLKILGHYLKGTSCPWRWLSRREAGSDLRFGVTGVGLDQLLWKSLIPPSVPSTGSTEHSLYATPQAGRERGGCGAGPQVVVAEPMGAMSATTGWAGGAVLALEQTATCA